MRDWLLKTKRDSYRFIRKDVSHTLYMGILPLSDAILMGILNLHTIIVNPQDF